ncbi:MAG TPA: imidazole glycerol phosphate synthase subunit HisH [Verrucomicrobiae bacterium]|nr:imidazole glycerol phosphate synthase subunit HisH [Verrucomicrobiae bacterium]
MIALVDYGMGNLRSVEKALIRVGGDVRIVGDAKSVLAADAVVLPGVGAFGDCMANLAKAGVVEAIRETIASKKPFLGICLGFQALLDTSEEAAGVRGLGIFSGSVPRFAVSGLKVPHMGWNELKIRKPGCPLLEGVADGSRVYFVHSYYCQPESASVVCGTTEYGIEFCSMLWSENVYATQFHPEKSQAVGLKMLENFVRIRKKTGDRMTRGQMNANRGQ